MADRALLTPPRVANPGITLLKIAAVYMLAGLAVGVGMGMAQDFSLVSVHTHVLLLGWGALSVTGIVYLLLPGCASSRLAKWHFWAHNSGLPVMLVSLTLFHRGTAEAEKVVAGASMVVFASLVLFTVNLYMNAMSE